jgi:hypothetical protein
MENFLQIGSGVDVTSLLLSLKRQPHLWKPDDYIRNHRQAPEGEMQSIILRFPVSVDQPDPHENYDYEAMHCLPEARTIAMNLMAAISGERLGRVLINRIMPKGATLVHADEARHAAYYDRFHIPLETQPGVEFQCGDETVYMGRGEIWWFQNALQHQVRNNSNVPRIHLIVDIRTPRHEHTLPVDKRYET